jgi:hypothetical protein
MGVPVAVNGIETCVLSRQRHSWGALWLPAFDGGQRLGVCGVDDLGMYEDAHCLLTL